MDLCQRPASGVAACIALRAIDIYQRHVSPRKGFVCAHRVLHGGESCSEFGRRAVMESGVLRALRRLQTRFQECRAAATVLAARRFEERLADEAEAKRKRLEELEGANPQWLEACSFCSGVSEAAEFAACCFW